MSPPVFRFAPSPNGFLHLGHARSALLNFDLAERTGGRMLLRIEDIDTTRCRPDYEQAIYEDLAWLGITWEKPVRRQSSICCREAVERLTRDGLIIRRLRAATLPGSLPRKKSAPGRVIPTVPRLCGMGKHLTADERAKKSLLVRPGPYGLTWTRLLRTGSLSWMEEGGRMATGHSRARVGRHSRPQGHAHQLSPVRRDRRCPAGRDPCGARAGPVLGHRRASLAAAIARAAAAGLSPPWPRVG